MANYTQVNIYRKQMQDLGLNTKQYAKLIDMPYEVVKDFMYDKEGDYSMDIKDVLRRNIFSKHQEIENNFENAKIKATEIKYQDTDNKRTWYENEYTPDLLCYKLNIKSRAEFERNYDILVDGERASKWFYTNITGKRNYDNHEISDKVMDQFIDQLYDIIVNGNGEKYKRSEPTEIKQFPTQRKPIKSKNYKNKYFEWFRDFDIKAYLKNNKMTYHNLADELNMGIYTIHQLVNKKFYSKRTLEKLFKYVKENEKPEELIYETKIVEPIHEVPYVEKAEEIEVLPMSNVMTEAEKEILREQPQVITSQQNQDIEVITSNDDILRKILINRLTDEEKELIKIFGGKLC